MKQIAFGKYTLHHRIARGGMAELFLARSAETDGLDRLVVIKLVSSRYAKETSFLTMFEDEVRIMTTLNHPNIGQVFEVGEVAGCYFLAMEYIFGKDLRSLTSRCLKTNAPVPPATAAAIGAKICAGLHHAHEARGPDGASLQIVHRDVSLSNIMVTYDGQVKLIDFGIAKVANRSALTMPGMIKGKARYLAPEQVMDGDVDRRSDIYTLGISLWEASVGQHLFNQKLDVHVYEAVAKGWVRNPSELVADYPKELERIVLKALAHRPRDRYQTALEMQQDLETYARTNGYPLTALALSRFMYHHFAEEMASWQKALAQKKSLLEYLISVIEPRDHQHDLDEVLATEDERITCLGLEQEQESATPQTDDAPAATPVLEQPRKTILYGSEAQEPPLQEPPPADTSPSTTAAASSPSRVDYHRVSTEGPVAINPDGTADRLATDARPKADQDDRRPTLLAGSQLMSATPPVEDQPRRTILGGSNLFSKVPAGQQRAAMPSSLGTSKTLPAMSAPAKAPTSEEELRAAIQKTFDVVQPAGKPAPAAEILVSSKDYAESRPVWQDNIPPTDPALDPIIGQDQRDLEQRRNQRARQDAAMATKTKTPTGDWAHQATSKGGKRVGTHPYFSFFHDISQSLLAEEGADDFVLHRRRKILWLIPLGAIVIAGGVGLWYYLSRTPAAPDHGSKKEPPAVAAPVLRQVELISEPSGATVFDAAQGKELGQTPLAISLPEGAPLRVELHLDGYEAQKVTVNAYPPRQTITLLPEKGTEQVSTPHPETKKRSSAQRPHKKRPKKKSSTGETIAPIENGKLINPFR